MNSLDTIDQDITGLAEVAFETMLGSKPQVAATDQISGVGDHLSAVVQITGAWNGAVTISVSRETARLIGTRLFMTEELEEGEVSDAVCEMVNVIGGQFKSLLEPPSQLSLPSVTEGVDHHTSIPGGVTRCDLTFDWEGHMVRVTVLHKGQKA